MKRILLFYLFTISVISINAQDSRYVGTWKWHYDSPWDDEIEGPHNRDEYIRIDNEDNKFYVRVKIETKNYKGLPIVIRRDGENIEINTDGSISFDGYNCKNEYDNDDHLYWTVWTHYNVKYEGGCLKVIEKLMGIGCNKYGIIVKDDRNKYSSNTTQKTYYNEKDNW